MKLKKKRKIVRSWLVSRKPLALLLTLAMVFEGLFFGWPKIAHAAVNCADTGVTGVTETECLALMAFYNSTGGSSWTNKTNWDTASAVTDWYGVDASGGHVTRVIFNSGNNMVGTLPTELGNLTWLNTLTIASNATITGSLPVSISNITNLLSLNIYSTGISGTIPSEYANLTRLTNFYVNNNLLSGSIPEIFSGMTSLVYVLLQGNQFTGTMPANWPASLDWLWIYSNNLTGPVPSGLASIPLVQLKIEDNKLVFSDFENEFATYRGFSVFTYSTQKNVDTVRTVMVDDGETAIITPSVVANANDSYQWYKGGVLIPGATSRVFTKTASASDAGVYTYRVTNSVVTGLTLQSNNITLGINPNPPTSDSVYYIVDSTGENVWVRGSISATKDIAQQYTLVAATVPPTNNQNINFGATYTINSTTPNLISSYDDGTYMGYGGDEATPVSTSNAGYVMENHGLYMPVVTSYEHDKSDGDIGSTWSDGVHEFILAEYDEETITFYCKPFSSQSSWAMASAVATAIDGSMTWVRDGTNHGPIHVDAKASVQKYPLVKNVTRHVLVNGTVEASNNSGGYADYVDLTEEFDLMDPSTIDITNNPFAWNGTTDVWMHVKTTYRATGGRTVIHTTYDIQRPINLGYFGFIQTSYLAGSSYDHKYIYIPKTKPVDGYDFKAVQLFDSNPASTVVIDEPHIDDVNNPPDREIRFFKDTADPNYDIGLAFGYSPYLDSAAENRTCASYDTGCWRISTIRKSYPVVDGGIGVIDDTSYEVYAYRQWIDPTTYDIDKSAYWNNMNGHDLVYIDYHKSVTNDVTALPTSMVGKAIRVVESENVTVADTVVQAGGVTLSTTGANTYGYAVLELTAQDPVLHSTACPSDGGWCNDATPDFDVTNNVAGQHYHYLVNQTAVPSAAAVQSGTEDADGAFTISGGTIGAEGTWYVHVITQSDNGDYSNDYTSYTIKYDGTIPTATAVASPLSANGSNGWFMSVPAITLSAIDALSGISAIRYFWDMDGESIYSSSFTVSEGIHTLNYYAQDNAENPSVTSTQEFKIDATAPADFTPAVDPATTTKANSVNVTFTTTDATSGLAGYSIKVDSGTYANSVTSPYALDVSALSDGTHTVTVKAVDNAGNIREHGVDISIDRTAPVISGGSPSGNLSSAVTQSTLMVTTNESATCKYSTNSGTSYSNMTDSFTTTNGTIHRAVVTGLKAGYLYKYYVRCGDGLGNINNSDYHITFTIANVVQRPRLRSPVLAGGASPNITITGQAVAGQIVKIFLDGRAIKTLTIGGTAGETKSFSTKIKLNSITSGQHRVYAKAYDSAGQASEASSTIKIKISRSVGKTRVMLNTGATYVVISGDSLWKIARSYLGRGSKYTKIVKLNTKKFPTLVKYPSRILIGWVLKIPAN